jgi:GTP-binding protein HflX
MDQVFATLDPAVRRLILPDRIEVLLIDTVGFIRKLPHHLVDAFHSTLEEVTSADAILQIIDVSDPDVAAQMAVVEALLLRLQAAGKPRLIVFNKMDVLTAVPAPIDPDWDDFAPSGLPPDLAVLIPAGQSRQAFLVSAVTGEGIDALLDAISELARHNQIQADLIIPYASAGLLDYIRRHGRVIKLDYWATGIAVTMAIKYSHFSPLRHFVRLAEKPEKR